MSVKEVLDASVVNPNLQQAELGNYASGKSPSGNVNGSTADEMNHDGRTV